MEIIHGGFPRLYHHKDEIYEGEEGKGVRSAQKGCPVEEYVPFRIPVPHFLDEALHTGRTEKLGTGCKRVATRYHGQFLDPGPHHQFGEWGIMEEMVAEPLVAGIPQHLAYVLVSKVTVDKQHRLLKILGKRQGQIDRGKCLPLSGKGTGNQDGDPPLASRQLLNPRAEYPVVFHFPCIGLKSQTFVIDNPLRVKTDLA